MTPGAQHNKGPTRARKVRPACSSAFARITRWEATSRRAVEREWRKQRELAGPYGSSHVEEIDAIFSRHL